ncbi:MAG: metallophosphoesterase, partial [Magnetococcales bacterium]|nr:metallophosphoesterase [Magnetococcales bacterium]
MSKPLRWLHISDIHMGCPGKELWWQTNQEFGDTLREMVARQGAPDLLLITGDIAWSGAKAEYDSFDRFLDQLLTWLTDNGKHSKPLVIPVPGNHDLDRRQVDHNPLLQLFGKSLGTEAWPLQLPILEQLVWQETGTSPLHVLFQNYLEWFDRRIAPCLGKGYHPSPFPGDFSLQLDLPGKFPLTLVGLNSAWMHYQKEGNFLGKLELLAGQLPNALANHASGNPLERIKENALMLMHHPVSWFSRATRQLHDEKIYPSGRFHACLCGHAHTGDAEFRRHFGDRGRCTIMAPSLFGLEGYQTAHESRSMGFMWGSLDQTGEVRLWPYLQTRRGGGNWAFAWDPRAKEHEKGVSVCDGDGRIEHADMTPWLQSLLDRTQHIKISGIGTGKGRGKEAKPVYPIEDLYTTLKSRDERGTMDRGHESLLLQQLLPHHARLLIEGAPGSGKTTFLKLVATMLARDLLGIPCPDGTSWRKRHLGLDNTQKPKI